MSWRADASFWDWRDDAEIKDDQNITTVLQHSTKEYSVPVPLSRRLGKYRNNSVGCLGPFTSRLPVDLVTSFSEVSAISFMFHWTFLNHIIYIYIIYYHIRPTFRRPAGMQRSWRTWCTLVDGWTWHFWHIFNFADSKLIWCHVMLDGFFMTSVWHLRVPTLLQHWWLSVKPCLSPSEHMRPDVDCDPGHSPKAVCGCGLVLPKQDMKHLERIED